VKFSSKFCIATAITAALTFSGPSAYADHQAEGETCVETPAVPGQAAQAERVHYVWTGGPTRTAPDRNADDWKATKGKPKGKPHQQDDGVVYNVSKKETGLGSWFKWETVELPPIIAVPAHECSEPEVPVDDPKGNDKPGKGIGTGVSKDREDKGLGKGVSQKEEQADGETVGELPKTGGDTWVWILGIGAVLVAAGSGLIYYRRNF
jgi:LPXTG-motif cell wall-anchored protein